MSDAISKMHAEVAPRAQVELRLPGNQDGDDADQDWADELERLEDGEAVRLIREASIMQLACNQHTFGAPSSAKLRVRVGEASMQSAHLGTLHPAKLFEEKEETEPNDGSPASQSEAIRCHPAAIS